MESIFSSEVLQTGWLQALTSISIGLGLAAACGFRVFLPLFLVSGATRLGFLGMAGSFEWMGSTPALVAFGSATVLEIAAYYIPFVDNLLDSVATPAAILAGALMMMTQVGDQNPLLAYSLAAVGGAGAAGAVQGITTVTRQVSSLATAGFGNPLLATFEAAGAVVMAFLAIFLPLIAVAALVALVYLAAKRLFLRPAAEQPPQALPSA